MAIGSEIGRSLMCRESFIKNVCVLIVWNDSYNFHNLNKFRLRVPFQIHFSVSAFTMNVTSHNIQFIMKSVCELFPNNYAVKYEQNY